MIEVIKAVGAIVALAASLGFIVWVACFIGQVYSNKITALLNHLELGENELVKIFKKKEPQKE